MACVIFCNLVRFSRELSNQESAYDIAFGKETSVMKEETQPKNTKFGYERALNLVMESG